MEKINFLMGLHCHQPADNLRTIFEEAYNKSYQPFLSVLEKHPKIKLSLHYSGSVLDWLVENRPDFMERIKRLVDTSQVEILTGGYFEPILSMIPPEDAKGQIEMLTLSLEKYFNYKPNGIWVTERVWDPALSSIFKDLNVRYTVLDDFHLKQAGRRDGEFFGHYALEDLENFSVFPSIGKLRYTMPFREPEVTIDFLKRLRDKPNVHCITFGDDCEKFGFWPHTYNWVYKKGWLEKFFTMLEENDWLRTLTFREAIVECPSLGKVRIPHSGYSEMAEWCRGNFNNFFRIYPESDLMRKRMLYVSQKIGESEKCQKEPERQKRIEKGKLELYKSQCNCAYWHGIFGGVYTNHLRQGIYSHIIKAEDFFQTDSKAEEIEMVDPAPACRGGVNLSDTQGTIILARNRFLTLCIDPNYSGSLFEIDYRPLSYNLVNTMSRRYEPYHELLKKKSKLTLRSRSQRGSAGCNKQRVEDFKKKVDEDIPIDLYQVLGVKERNLTRLLHYDSYQKFSAIAYIMDLKTSLRDFIKSTHIDGENDDLFGPYKYEAENEGGRLVIKLQRDSSVRGVGGSPTLLRLNKCIILEKGPEIFIKFDVENLSSALVKFMFGVEFNWTIKDVSFMHSRCKRYVRKIALADKSCGLKISHTFREPVNMWSFPVYTLNESETGIKKNFQEISLLFYRKLTLDEGAKFSLETRILISDATVLRTA